MPAGRYGFNVRIPAWTSGEYRLKLNGEDVPSKLSRGYARIEREWTEGDHLTLSLDLLPRRV